MMIFFFEVIEFFFYCSYIYNVFLIGVIFFYEWCKFIVKNKGSDGIYELNFDYFRNIYVSKF